MNSTSQTLQDELQRHLVDIQTLASSDDESSCEDDAVFDFKQNYTNKLKTRQNMERT